MAELPLHPRLAHMVLRAREPRHGARGLRPRGRPERARFHRRFRPGRPTRTCGCAWRSWPPARRPVAGGAAALRGRPVRLPPLPCGSRTRSGGAGLADRQGAADADVGRMLAWAYPDRIGQRRPGEPGRFLLANGRGALFRRARAAGGVETASWPPTSTASGGRRACFSRRPAIRPSLPGGFPATRCGTQEIIDWDRRSAPP
ncbi:MAG: hypothetical protein MZV70_48460 [Desulfobacterales bacterium]|nr:hypothetical protein [Desulfobacterales bacterium]